MIDYLSSYESTNKPSSDGARLRRGGGHVINMRFEGKTLEAGDLDTLARFTTTAKSGGWGPFGRAFDSVINQANTCNQCGGKIRGVIALD